MPKLLFVLDIHMLVSYSDPINEQLKRFENLKQRLEGPELQREITTNLDMKIQRAKSANSFRYYKGSY